MNRYISTIFLLLIDAISVAAGWMVDYKIRQTSETFAAPLPIEFFSPIAILVAFWWIMSWLRGMYRTPIALSRFEEMIRVLKNTLVGILIIYIATYDAGQPIALSRILLLSFGLTVFVVDAVGRMFVRQYQRYLRQKRKGLWNAVIVGWSKTAADLHKQLSQGPIWGFNVVGFVDSGLSPRDESVSKMIRDENISVLGDLNQLPEIIKSRNIDWVMVAPQDQNNEVILQIFDQCTLEKVRLMIVANYYQMVLGLVQSVELHGLPLVEVAAQFIPLPVRIVKRSMDIVLSSIALFFILLAFPFIALAIKLESKGPAIYKQKRMGRKGKEYYIYKFRSMVSDAETKTGAVWAQKNDPRVTKVGNILRKTHIDELPQFFNVLKGDMSLVGPRPERKKFVEEFKKKIPLYGRRLLIRPGITGWAQVRHKYDETFEDVKEKTRYDLFYMNHISIALDIKIILLTIVRVLTWKGH